MKPVCICKRRVQPVIDVRTSRQDAYPPWGNRTNFCQGTLVRGCQMAIARFKISCVWPFGLEELWLCYAALQNLVPSFPWIAPHALHPGAIQGKEGIKFCYLATMREKTEESGGEDKRRRRPRARARSQTCGCRCSRLFRVFPCMLGPIEIFGPEVGRGFSLPDGKI